MDSTAYDKGMDAWEAELVRQTAKEFVAEHMGRDKEREGRMRHAAILRRSRRKKEKGKVWA